MGEKKNWRKEEESSRSRKGRIIATARYTLNL
jgi:hypothetical protein